MTPPTNYPHRPATLTPVRFITLARNQLSSCEKRPDRRRDRDGCLYSHQSAPAPTCRLSSTCPHSPSPEQSARWSQETMVCVGNKKWRRRVLVYLRQVNRRQVLAICLEHDCSWHPAPHVLTASLCLRRFIMYPRSTKSSPKPLGRTR